MNTKHENIQKSDKIKKLSKWELSTKIQNIINSNMKEIPFEGTEVDKLGLHGSILELIFELCPEYRPDGWGNPNPW